MSMDLHTKKDRGDWHPADIIAALWKRGITMRGLAKEKSLAASTLAQVNQAVYPRAERIIADALGLHPKVIWPSRYDAESGASLARPKGRPRKGEVSRPRKLRHVRKWEAK